ncbi:amidinotransferase [Pseudomaricurvus alcaniphilus]|uniref:dimethylarginine dimethylaminohydrolase family protein n=1 Tax=Pseudomaricurvus alcaniphilus TaxID=1166482 RepID=UPI001409DCFE|nr:arginine deiminase family protein [Pseudomaricurvus alcaniphilus]NHN39843.1 amidinotransferase [Pseudomaricurvus alcaniphilus]
MTEFTFQNRQRGGGTTPLQDWGIDSETGVLRDVLLGPPDNFQWLASNATSRRSLRKGFKFDQQAVYRQHAAMRACYEAAGVKVHMLEPDPALPYQIFTRDSSVMTPWGAIVSQMSNHWRRGEYAEIVRFYQRQQIPVYDMITSGTFEGGDFQVIKPGVVLCGYSGDRTSKAAIDQVSAWFEAEGWEFFSYEFDPFYLHIDVVCSMLTDGLAAVCVDAVEPELIQWLSGHGIEVVDISFRDAIRHMGCNVVSLGGDRVLLPEEATRLQEICRAHGLEVFSVDVSMISAGGGSLHCMCQPLRRDRV